MTTAGDSWLQSFTRARGRRPRVLHVGNVANNAYLNACLLNEAGVESDVLCYGNYHFMASPEWEELDGAAEGIDQERPDWRRVSSRRFERPRWFAQGPFPVAARYLEARRAGRRWEARLRWRQMEARRQAVAGGRGRWLRALRDRLRPSGSAGAQDNTGTPAIDSPEGDRARYARSRGWSTDGLRRLFRHYDVVHGYGAEPILPYVAGQRPYVAWEHGTLRHLPFQPTPEGRLTAAAYADADAVVITNADNREAAERLGIARYRFIPHPVSETRPSDASVARLREALRARLRADCLVFHPSRQHWGPDRHPHFEKGNDRLIEGLARACRQRPGLGAVFVEWGATVEASRALIARLGLADRVLWVPPQTGISLARHMLACEVMADQFFLGAFGSTLPRAMGLGVATLIHLDVPAHRWCFPEAPPVMNASDPEEIASLLVRACDDVAWREELAARGLAWYQSSHSAAEVRRRLLGLYADVLSRSE